MRPRRGGPPQTPTRTPTNGLEAYVKEAQSGSQGHSEEGQGRASEDGKADEVKPPTQTSLEFLQRNPVLGSKAGL